MWRAGLVCAVFAFGCGHGKGPGGTDGGTEAPHLELSPADAMVTIVNGAAQMQPYTATLVAADGTRSDVTSEVSFSLADASYGAFSGASLTVTGAAAGPTRVVASDPSGDTGNTTLTVFVQDRRNDGMGVPANPDQLFGGATETPARAPTLAYPADGVLMPPNLGAFDVQWTDTAGNNLFAVTLQTQYVTVTIYKAATSPGDTSYTPEEWRQLASTRENVTLTVAGMDVNNPTQKGTSAPQHVEATNEMMTGGIYFWTAMPLGVSRYDMSTPDVPPSPFFPAGQEPGGSGNCMGCHALSHDGTKLALTIDAADGRGTVFNVADGAVLVPYDTNAQYWNFATFTPDASKLVTVKDGQMVLRQTMGGATIGSPLPNSPNTRATHPELSPDGTRLANVETPSSSDPDYEVVGGSIVVRSFDAATDTFGTATTIVANAGGAANFYPSWSPDGQWILFTRTSGDSYNSSTAQVWVVKADGSMPPIQLKNADTQADSLYNSWAHWAPLAQTYGANGSPVYFITFSSARPFGVREPSTEGTNGPNKQIWMAPFFPDKAAAGQDPSGPAFRMPFQDFATSNHIAQWTSQVIIGRKADGSPLSQAEAYAKH